MNYEQLRKVESEGAFNFGIDIKIASPNGVQSDGIKAAAYQAAALLEEAIKRDFYANSEDAQERARTFSQCTTTQQCALWRGYFRGGEAE